MVALMPINTACAETLADTLNNLVGPSQQYNTIVSPAYLRNNVSEDHINPQSGELILTQTDYVLPGRNGLDLEIKRMYKSGTASWYKSTVKWSGGAWVDYLDDTFDESNLYNQGFYEMRYNLGCGWRFSFPTIENRQNSDGSTYKYLHTESGDIYRMIGPTLVNNINTYTLENHPVKDIEIKENSTFSSYGTNVSGARYTMTSKYVITEKNGKKTYFDPDGRILGIVDRYNNTIRFEYINFVYNLSEGAITKVLISKIIDTVGREVSVEYKENPNFTVKDYDPNTNTASGDLEYNFQVIISLPNGKKIVYDKGNMNFRTDTLHNVRCRLRSVYDVDATLPINSGSPIKYRFSYEQPKLGFTYFNGTNYNNALRNTYENITDIYDFKFRKRNNFIYGTYTKRLNNGSMEYRKVITEKNIDSVNDNTKDQTAYTYTNEPDGFGYAGYNANDDNYLKNIYKYYTNKTDMRGAKVKYTYDGKGELIALEDYGNDHKEVTTITFDTNRLPQKKVREVYKIGLPIRDCATYVENYVFDAFGNMTSYTDPLADRDNYGDPMDSEHTTTYTYATDRYHIPTSKTWKKDAAATLKIEYDVASNGNVTQERKIHAGNNLVSDYQYDSYGNMTRKTVRYADNSGNTYITNYEYGTDRNNVNHKGAYLTKEYSTVDGVEIAKNYTYDFNTGNMIDSYDENNNKTSYEYDIFSRLIKITYPDFTTKQYDYYCFNLTRRIDFIDQKNQSSEYYYDIFGRLVTLFRDGIAVQRIEYDSNGNKTKEIDAKGNSTRYAYDSQNRLIRKSFWENDTTEKKDMTLSYDTITYGLVSQYIAITDEEDYVKKYYYDKLNRLIMIDMTPDKTNFYSKVYALDYVGNTVNIKDFRGKYTFFTYDDLNRLNNMKDALGGETRYYYDAGGNITQVTNAKGINSYNEYDGLGRKIRSKIPRSDGSTCTVRYIYDKAGNKTKEINPRYYDPAKDTPALASTMTGISYAYNNMNRLISTLSPEGAILEYRKYDGNGNIQKVIDGLRYNGNVDTSPGTRYEYDVFDRVTYAYNALNQMIKRNVYDIVGNITDQYDANGNRIHYDYNPDRTLRIVTYPDGGTIQYTYDKLGRKLTQTDQLGNTTTYTNNGFGMQTATDTLGRYTKNYYDSNGNITGVETLRDGNYDINKYEYDDLNRMTKSIRLVDESDINNAVSLPNIANLRDSAYPGRIKIITGYEYDAVGNKTKTVDPRAYGYLDGDTANRDKFTTWHVYDPADRLEKITRKYNGTDVYTQYHYDAAGNNDWEKDERGFITNYTYDNMNRLLSMSDALNKTVTYGYDLLGNRTSVTNAKGTTTYGYDIINRLATVTNPANLLTSKKTYDANNNIINEYDAKGYQSGYYTIYTYDTMNRLQTVIDPEMRAKYGTSKNTIKYEYNKAGQKTRVTDALGNITQYQYDVAGRLKNVIDAGNNITSYDYDKAGNMLYTQYTINGGNKKTNYSYGAFGLLKSTTDADNLRIVYKYDLALNTAGMTDKNGNTTLYTYDLTKKMLSRSVTQTGDSVTYDYDAAGNRKSMTDATGTTTYNYNNNNWLKDVIKGGATQIHYEYDDVGNIVSVTDKKGFVTGYSYDSCSRMYTVTFSGKTTTYTYDANGNRQSITYPGGTKEEYTYNKNNKLLTLTNKNPGGGVISNYSYTYYDNGLQNTRTDSCGTTTYTYCPAGQIKTVTAPGKTTVYTYDGAGNRQTASETYASDQSSGYTNDDGSNIKYRVKSSQYLYSNTGKLLSIVESMRDAAGSELLQKKTGYTYDKNGNQTHSLAEFLKPAATGTMETINIGAYSDNIKQPLDSTIEITDNTYDGFNRLKKAETIKSGKRAVAEFFYNGDDLRIQKVVKKLDAGYTPEVTNYLYSGSHVILETDVSDNVKTRYIQGINYICR
jgi:YD repeat-containing protein